MEHRGQHPLLREIRIGRLVGWPLLAVTLAAGPLAGLLALAISDPVRLTNAPQWLAIPASVPVCYALVAGRSLLVGALSGLFAAALAFVTIALYAVWQVACFIITFMGDC